MIIFIAMQIWGLIMNKRGMTILEILVSLVIVSIIVLLLIRTILALEGINNSKDYASSDVIGRATLIKNIEKDLMDKQLVKADIQKEDKQTKIVLNFRDSKKTLIVEPKKIVYDGLDYSLESNNASYSLDINYVYEKLEDNCYVINIDILVLIGGVNTTVNDDINLTFMGLEENSDNNTN